MKCCDIKPSELNRKIGIQRLQVTPDELGGFSESWVQVADVWAKIEPMTGRETLRADRLNAPQMYRFLIRFRRDLKTNDKLVLRDEPYNIRSIVNLDLADRWMEVLAERDVAQ